MERENLIKNIDKALVLAQQDKNDKNIGLVLTEGCMFAEDYSCLQKEIKTKLKDSLSLDDISLKIGLSTISGYFIDEVYSQIKSRAERIVANRGDSSSADMIGLHFGMNNFIEILSNEQLKTINNKATADLSETLIQDMPEREKENFANSIQLVKRTVIGHMISKRIEQVSNINQSNTNLFYKTQKLAAVSNEIQEEYREFSLYDSVIASEIVEAKAQDAQEKVNKDYSSEDSIIFDSTTLVKDCYQAVDKEYESINEAESSEMVD